MNPSLVPRSFFATQGNIFLVNGQFRFHSLQLQILWCSICSAKCGTSVGHDNSVLRHFIAKIVFSEVPIAKEWWCRPCKEKPLSLTEKLWHSNFPSSQTNPNCSRNSWKPSYDLVSVLHVLVSCILPWSLSSLQRRLAFSPRDHPSLGYLLQIIETEGIQGDDSEEEEYHPAPFWSAHKKWIPQKSRAPKTDLKPIYGISVVNDAYRCRSHFEMLWNCSARETMMDSFW